MVMMTIDNGNGDYKENVEMKKMKGMGKNVLFFYYSSNKLRQGWWPEVCGLGWFLCFMPHMLAGLCSF